jgi:hypothetical protein
MVNSVTITSIVPVSIFGFSVPAKPLLYLASDGNAVLGTQGCRLFQDTGRGGIRAEDDLNNAAAVAEMNEKKSAMITEGINPACKQHRMTDILCGQPAAKNPFGK